MAQRTTAAAAASAGVDYRTIARGCRRLDNHRRLFPVMGWLDGEEPPSRFPGLSSLYLVSGSLD